MNVDRTPDEPPRLGLRFAGGVNRETLPNIEDVNNFIQTSKNLPAKPTPDFADEAAQLHHLGAAYGERYDRSRTLADLDRAVELFEESLNLTPLHHENRASRLRDLAAAHHNRCLKIGGIEHLNKAIPLYQECLETSPSENERASCLRDLGAAYADKYRRTLAETDLNTAIQLMQESVDSTPRDDAHRAPRLLSLGAALGDRFQRVYDSSDVDKSIPIYEEYLDRLPLGHPDRSARLRDLAAGFQARYVKLGTASDIARAIKLYLQSADEAPEGNPSRAARFRDVGGGYRDRFKRTGDTADLSMAIKAFQNALGQTPGDGEERAALLHEVGAGYADRYARIGNLADLNATIPLVQEAVDLTPTENPRREVRLIDLGAAIHDRYRRTGSLSDLDEAIEIYQQAVDKTASANPFFPSWVQLLGLGWVDKYRQTGDTAHLDKAIELYQACEEPKLTGISEDLHDAMRALHEILQKSRADNPRWISLRNNLGVAYHERYTQSRKMTDLGAAIKLYQETLERTPPDHPTLAIRLRTYGSALYTRYQTTQKAEDMQTAIESFRTGLNHSSAPIQDRLSAGRFLLWILAEARDWEHGYEAAKTLIRLVPLLAPRSLENSDKQHWLSGVAGLASDAAAIALNANKDPFDALQLLELGRGIISGSLNDIRADVDELVSSHPDLGKRYLALRQQLDTPAPPSPIQQVSTQRDPSQGIVSSMNEHMRSSEPMILQEPSRSDIQGYSQPSWQSQANVRHEANGALDDLLVEIRGCSGFEDFLLAPSEQEMRAAAKMGPLVVVNVSQYRCDAILIEEHQIRALPLENLLSQEIREKAQLGDLGKPRTLKWLWDTLASPVLDALRFTQSPTDHDATQRWPHVWWIPTGALTKFPLHAAGIHSKGGYDTVMDRVMSSYSASVKAIIHGRRQRVASFKPAQALLVALKDTPGVPTPLPFTLEEVKELHQLCESMGIEPIEPGRRKQDIVRYLPNCKIFHFAGHGHTNHTDPSRSQLLLEDGTSDPFTVASLIDLNLQANPPFLAYLSACGTGKVEDERFIDESMHLISACQLAGFRHVIGTFWEVNDKTCVDMAKFTYQGMKEDRGVTDESVCRGLHRAALKLRDRWLNTMDKIECELVAKLTISSVQDTTGGSRGGDQRDDRAPRDAVLDADDDEEDGAMYWVPYVHFGV
ncbi:CHAT domain-containing protein [Ilyonectria sp. MPI-CAGE-AT-0026]|nr:CHAT domain-containing protein [Ilyonectria sp. MPI-CAGE-AT-0026]